MSSERNRWGTKRLLRKKVRRTLNECVQTVEFVGLSRLKAFSRIEHGSNVKIYHFKSSNFILTTVFSRPPKVPFTEN